MLNRIHTIAEFTEYFHADTKKNHCCRNKKKENARLITKFCELFDALERKLFTFHEAKEDIEKTRALFSPYIAAAELFLEYLDDAPQTLRTDKVWQRIVGLQYRIEEIHGGLDPLGTADPEVFALLIRKAETFKKEQKLFPEPMLINLDFEKLKETAKYFTFAKLILKHKILRDIFFKWILRDNNGVAQFIEFPATAERMRETFIDKRVGFLNPCELSIVKINHQKMICLPFFDGENVQRINILNEAQEIILNNQRKLTLKEIFDIFKQKNIEPGNLEYVGKNGIMNWAIYEFGAWNSEKKDYDRIDFSKKEWWKDLPVFNVVSKIFLEKFYKITLGENEWVQIVKATRESLDFDLLKRHGYIEIAIPMGDDLYALYPFGVYPSDFPATTFEQTMLITKTVLGEMAYPDENEFYSQRQHAAFATVISPELGQQKMDAIKKLILKALHGQLTFQFGGENCSFYADEIARNKESFFKMPVLEMKPTHPGIEFVLKFPEILQSYSIRLMQILALWYGQPIKEPHNSYYKCTFFADKVGDMQQYQPARLFQQIDKKERKGVISFGN